MRCSAGDLSTAIFSDACLRLGIRPRSISLRSLIEGTRIAGPAVAVRHVGSVDVFLEAIGEAPRGAILAIDNGGRLDEACIGDLVGIEAQAAGLSGIVVWGLHRDSRELRELRIPVFSLGTMANGPVRLDPRVEPTFGEARMGDFLVTNGDAVVADDDGVLFFPGERYDEIVAAAIDLRDVEAEQARRVKAGVSLRDQFRFAAYLERRRSDPARTFRDHLRDLKAEIEV
ncbi:MAG: RraA family protein [Candidatus Eremiobacteraeota bacterium]|nr:RraA family protein [Candidatus Eremiobacteraeota bacterium]